VLTVMQGMGKHTMEEVMEKLETDLAVCETLLEDSGAFLTGATPTQADCFLYGILDHVRCLESSSSAPSIMALQSIVGTVAFTVTCLVLTRWHLV
jgi:glutathione S-transferase